MGEHSHNNPSGLPRWLMPPVICAAAIAAMAALSYLAPGPRIVAPVYTGLGWTLAVAGVFVIVSVKLRFDRAGTTIKPFEKSEALVTDGLFTFSRNPIYVSMVGVLLGMAVVFASLTPVIVIPVFAWIIGRRFIKPEEGMMEDAFGDDYRAYRARVRRWL